MDRPQIYGWDVSPYTEKAFAYLKYKQLDPIRVFPNLFQLKFKVEKDVGRMIMPVIYERNTTLQDSSAIIDHYESLHPSKSVIPDAPLHKISSLIMELLGDDWLVLAALHYRWNYPENNKALYKTFGRLALPLAPKPFQILLGKKMGRKLAAYLPSLGITETMQMPLENNTQQILQALELHLAQHHFLLGSRPCIGDFGLYGPIYAHLYKDPFPNQLLKPYPNIRRWIARLSDSCHLINGNWISSPSLPATLLPLFQIWRANHLPLIKASIEAFDIWCQTNPNSQIVPRQFGKTQLNIDGVTSNRANQSYVLWMWQRLQNTYKSLNEVEQNDVNGLLNQLDILKLIQTPLAKPLCLKQCRLHISPC